MASYDPPTEILPIFNQNVFTSSDTTLTIASADKRYLKYPTGQGTETIPKLIINDQIQFNYTSNPTYSNTSLGYSERYEWLTPTVIPVAPGFTIASFTNLPVGLYIFAVNFTITGTSTTSRNDMQLTTQTNIVNLNCSSTLSYCGYTGIKTVGTPTFLLQVTDPTNTLLYKLVNINAPAGFIEPSASTITRIA